MKQTLLYDVHKRNWCELDPKKEIITIGRNEDNDVYIPMESEGESAQHVSRLHCMIYQGVKGEDMPKIGNCSKNNTFVKYKRDMNYQKVEKGKTLPLKDQCTIKLSDYGLWVRIAEINENKLDEIKLNEKTEKKKGFFSNFGNFLRK